MIFYIRLYFIITVMCYSIQSLGQCDFKSAQWVGANRECALFALHSPVYTSLYDYHKLGLFCRIDSRQWRQGVNIQARFRLGTVDYTEKLEYGDNIIFKSVSK